MGKDKDKPKTKTKKEVMAITAINTADDIFQILYRIHMDGRKDDKLAEKLICLLMRQKEWTHGHGMSFYELILREYAPCDELEELLAVSGISDGYKNFPAASKCRRGYLANHLDDERSENGMEKHERTVLERISKSVYRDFCAKDDRLLSLCKEWIFKVGIDISELGLLEDETESGMPDNEDDTEDDTQTSGSHPIIFFYNKLTYKPRRKFVTSLIVGAIACTFLHSLNKPSIKSISVDDDDLTVIAGQHADPGIEIRPTEAGKGNLEYRSGDKNIADMTLDLEVIGGNGWREDADNTTEIKLWGGNAAKTVIKVQLEPGYIDGAKDEEYRNQTDAGQYNDYDGAN